MPTERLRFVNMGSTTGGDGTTNGTAGGTRAYPDLDELIVNEGADIGAGGADVFLRIKLDRGSGGDDTDPVDITGFTGVDATHNIIIEGNSGETGGRHDGTDDGTFYRLSTNVAATHMITVNEAFTVFEGFIVGPMGASHSGSDEAFRVNVTGCLWDGMIGHDIDGSTSNDVIYPNGNSLTLKIKNCIFYNISRGCCLVQNDTSDVIILYNNTCYNGVTFNTVTVDISVFGPDVNAARDNTGTTYNVRNCAGHKLAANGRVYQEGPFGSGLECVYTADSDNNISSDGTADTVWNQGAWANETVDVAFQAGTGGSGDRAMFISLTGGSEDLHIEDNANNQMKEAGQDLSSDSDLAVTDDIDFVTRTGTFDLGADQVSALIASISDYRFRQRFFG